MVCTGFCPLLAMPVCFLCPTEAVLGVDGFAFLGLCTQLEPASLISRMLVPRVLCTCGAAWPSLLGTATGQCLGGHQAGWGTVASGFPSPQPFVMHIPQNLVGWNQN